MVSLVLEKGRGELQWKIIKIIKKCMVILNVQTAEDLLKKAIIFMMLETDFVKIVQLTIKRRYQVPKQLKVF